MAYKYSTITIYHVFGNDSTKSWKLSKDKNFIVDDIESYLNTFNKLQVKQDVQYLPFEVTRSLKLSLNQDFQMPFNTLALKYVKIEIEKNNILYYFIDSFSWISKMGVQLNLTLDILNTFKFGTNYKLTERSLITREHQDRFTIKEIESEQALKLQLINSLPPKQFDEILKNKNNIILRVQFLDVPDKWQDVVVVIDSFETPSGKITLNILLKSGLTWEDFFGDFSPGEDLRFSFDFRNIDENIGFQNANFISYQTTNQRFDLVRKVHILNENINPILYGKEIGYVHDLKFPNKNWYLIYRNQNEITSSVNNPIDILICTDEELKVKSTSDSSTWKWTTSDLPAGEKRYFANSGENYNSLFSTVDKKFYPLFSLADKNGVIYSTNKFLDEYKNIYPDKLAGEYISILVEIYNNGNNQIIVNYYWVFSQANAYHSNKFLSLSASEIQFQNANQTYVTNIELNVDYGNRLDTAFRRNSYFNVSFTNEVSGTISSIGLVNRTDPQIAKIIQLPYCPLNIQINENGEFELPNNFQVKNITQDETSINLINMINSTSSLLNSFETNIESVNNNLILENVSLDEQNKNIDYESKLYNSEFYQFKLIYDSFEFTYQLELMNYVNIDKLNLTFATTNSMNSRFLFIFNDLEIKDDLFTQAYPNLLYIARNNELTLYNNEYLNYLRTGYNYDVKQKSINANENWINFASSLLMGGVSAFANVADPTALAIYGTSAFKNLTGAISTQMRLENEMQRKITSSKMATTSVTASDAIDLMTIYTTNKLKAMEWTPSKTIKKMIFDLFYYYGYVQNSFKIPEIDTRIWFNFVQGEIEFDNNTNLNEQIKNMIKTKFKEGITFFHKYNNKWNLEQTLENWERSLIENGN